MKDETKIELEISFNPEGEDEEKVLKFLKSDGVIQFTKEPDRLGFTGIEIVYVCVLVGSVLFNLVIRLVRLWKCGVVVDTRPKKTSVTKNCELPRGSVMIIRKDGIQAEFKETQDLEIADFIKEAAAQLKGVKEEGQKK